MKFSELKEKNNKELNDLLSDTRKKIQNQRFEYTLGKLKQTSGIKKNKKLVARILTLLNEKQ